MAKKEMDEDLLTGGNLSTGKDKASKKAEKKAKAIAKQKEKKEKKRAAIKAEIEELKKAKDDTDNEAEIEKIDAKIKKLSAKYSDAGNTAGIALRTRKIITSVIAVVVVVALLVTYVATGAVRKGFIASLSLPAQTLNGVTVSNGTNKARIKVSTYNFYFASTYNSLQSQKSQYEQNGIDTQQLGLNVDFDISLSKQTYKDPETKEEMTWAEHLNDLVLDSIENTYTYYLAAVADNDGKEPEITEEQQKEIDDLISQYRKTANGYGYTLSGYLVKAMGKGVTESVFRQETTRQYIAQNYQSNLSSEVSSKEYTADDLNKYKSEHEEDLKTVDFKIFECSNEDDAKAFAGDLKSDGSNFAELAKKYASSDFYKSAYDDENYLIELGVTKSSMQNKGGYAIATADEHKDDEEHTDDEELVYSGLDWLFSKDRKAGDIKQYSTSVVYIISPAAISDRNTVNVRHILIAPETDDENTAAVDATTAQWDAAYKKAQSILDEFNSGDKTKDSFAKLVTDNSSDTGSVENGGLYENVVTGQMVNSFSDWCFDSSRKEGDTAIVKSDYGYHIMYFESTNSQKVWEYNAQNLLSAEDSKSATEKLEDEYTLKVHWFASRYFEKDVDIDA